MFIISAKLLYESSLPLYYYIHICIPGHKYEVLKDCSHENGLLFVCKNSSGSSYFVLFCRRFIVCFWAIICLHWYRSCDCWGRWLVLKSLSLIVHQRTPVHSFCVAFQFGVSLKLQSQTLLGACTEWKKEYFWTVSFFRICR